MFDGIVKSIERFFGMDYPSMTYDTSVLRKGAAEKVPVRESEKKSKEKEMSEEVKEESTEKSVIERAEEAIGETASTGEADLMKTEEESDDALFAQIDAFKAKAKELSGLIANKQAKVADLENLVSSREQQNEKLKAELELTRKQYKELEDKLDARFDAMKESLTNDLSKTTGDMVEQNREALEPVRQTVGNVSTELSEVKETTAAVNKSVSGMKEQIFDKVHTESIQSYKNLQEFIKENDHSDENRLSILTSIEKLKGAVTFVGVISVINMGMLVCMLLHILGVF